MKNFNYNFVGVLIFIFASVSARAETDRVNCESDSFFLATDLQTLPADVLAALRDGSNLANHGESFNLTDVGTENTVPDRRLAISAISDRRIFAAIEHGGVGYNVEIWAFERHGIHWHGSKQSTIFDAPTSLEELLSVTCPKPGSRPWFLDKKPENRIHCLLLGEGSKVLVIEGWGPYRAYKLSRNEAFRGTMKYREITDQQRHIALTTDEQVELVRKLGIIRSTIKNDERCIQTVEEFLQVLHSESTASPR